MKKGEAVDCQNHSDREVNHRVVDHPSERLCQLSKELVNVQDGSELEPIKER